MKHDSLIGEFKKAMKSYGYADPSAGMSDAVAALKMALIMGNSPKCTCYPDDNPPIPCPQKYAYSECVKAARSEIPVIDKALANAAEILANFTAGEAHEDGTLPRKLEEWQACYAKLFTQMAEMVATKRKIVSLQQAAKKMESYVHSEEWDFKDYEYAAQACADAWGIPHTDLTEIEGGN